MIQLLRPQRQMQASSELAAALGACRRAFLAIGLFSGMSNILMLTGSLFMLEVYDRVLPSRSVPTLVALLILTAGLYAAQGFIDAIRSRILVRIGDSLDETMSMRVYDAIVRLPLKIGGEGDGSQPIRDLDSVRGFLSGAGPSAFFDLPWLHAVLGSDPQRSRRSDNCGRRHHDGGSNQYHRGCRPCRFVRACAPAPDQPTFHAGCVGGVWLRRANLALALPVGQGSGIPALSATADRIAGAARRGKAVKPRSAPRYQTGGRVTAPAQAPAGAKPRCRAP
jgi:hypothetical protein